MPAPRYYMPPLCSNPRAELTKPVFQFPPTSPLSARSDGARCESCTGVSKRTQNSNAGVGGPPMGSRITLQA